MSIQQLMALGGAAGPQGQEALHWSSNGAWFMGDGNVCTFDIDGGNYYLTIWSPAWELIASQKLSIADPVFDGVFPQFLYRDAAGAWYVGLYNDFTSTRHLLLVKLTLSATVFTIAWQKKYYVGFSANWSGHIAEDADNLYLGCATDIGQDLVNSAVVKLAKADGTAGWAYYYRSDYPGSCHIAGIGMASDGGVIVGFNYLTGGGEAQGMLIKLNSAGVRQWNRSLTGETLDALVADPVSPYPIYIASGVKLAKLTADGASATWVKTGLGFTPTWGTLDSTGALWLGNGTHLLKTSGTPTPVLKRTATAAAFTSAGASASPAPGSVRESGSLLLLGRAFCVPLGDYKFGSYQYNAGGSLLTYASASLPALTTSTLTIGAAEPALKGGLAPSVSTPTVASLGAAGSYSNGTSWA